VARRGRTPRAAPPQRDAVLRRAGTTLIELLVALTLAAVLLGAATGSMLRQQRAARWVGVLGAAESQAAHVVRFLPDELTLLDARAGDVVPSQASDSTLELRAVVASSVTCDSATAVVTLAPDVGSAPPLGGVARAPAAGDTLWYFADSLGWRGRAVLGAARVTSACRSPRAANAATTRLVLDAPIDVGGGTPLRITRHERWVVYRASDGRWYVGLRDWSAATARFSAPQPVAGPFVRALRTGERTGFRYFDSLGVALVPDGTNEGAIARVRVIVLSSVAASGAIDTVRRDSADAALLRRGGP
jgi:prepilin-type N-terminal cleavage/methylation domain-containing protein